MYPLSEEEKSAMALTVTQARLPNLTILMMADRGTRTIFSAIPGVRDLLGPHLGGVRKDVTQHNTGGWQAYLSVLKVGGVLDFDLIYSADTHDYILDASLEQTQELFQIIFPDGNGLRFSALVELNFKGKVVGQLRAGVRLTLTGVVQKY